jgi:hypothetical protein
MSLSTTLSLSLQAIQSLASDNFATNTDPALFPYTGETFATGTAASQMDLTYRARRTISLSSSLSLDLAGVLTDRFGNVLTFARVKLIAIYNRAAIASGFVLGIGAGSACLASGTLFANTSDILNLRPQGLFLYTAPDATGLVVTATTADILKIDNSANGTAVDVDIMICGASA